VEKSNLRVDAALTSFAMYAITFSIVPSVIGITLPVMNNLAVGGARLWVKGCVATLLGIGTGALLLPWEFHLTSSLLVQAASLSLAAIYLIAFGWTMWCMAGHLEKSCDALHTLSQTDALSGLKNRGAFESALRQKFADLQAVQGQATAVLLLIDMDHFKRINDERGHAAGDAVVRAIGLALKSSIQQGDTASRYGGDEFVVLLNQADEPDALAFLDRMKKRIQAMDMSDPSITALSWSTGIALFDPSVPRRLTPGWLKRMLLCTQSRSAGEAGWSSSKTKSAWRRPLNWGQRPLQSLKSCELLSFERAR
jgi:diguanylate cyclase